MGMMRARASRPRPQARLHENQSTGRLREPQGQPCLLLPPATCRCGLVASRGTCRLRRFFPGLLSGWPSISSAGAQHSQNPWKPSISSTFRAAHFPAPVPKPQPGNAHTGGSPFLPLLPIPLRPHAHPLRPTLTPTSTLSCPLLL